MYIYRADLWCDDCGATICENLSIQGKAPSDPEDESSFDSDDYPKYFPESQSETDIPNHCAAGDECANRVRLGRRWCGALLEEALTPDGEAYVRDAHAQQSTAVTRYWVEMFDVDVEE